MHQPTNSKFQPKVGQCVAKLLNTFSRWEQHPMRPSFSGMSGPNSQVLEVRRPIIIIYAT